MAATEETKPKKPASLNRPVRRFVKRRGKKLMRWIAGYQSRQSIVPDTPFIDLAFPVPQRV